MIDRAEVERIRKNATVATGSGMDMWLPPEHIAELCGVYLAWLDAPEVSATAAQVVAFAGGNHYMASIGLIGPAAKKLGGKRVRLVTDAERSDG